MVRKYCDHVHVYGEMLQIGFSRTDRGHGEESTSFQVSKSLAGRSPGYIQYSNIISLQPFFESTSYTICFPAVEVAKINI